MRSDTLSTVIAPRPSGLRRIWVEDSFGRLTANGFAPGSPYVVESRMGPGVNVRVAGLSSTHVSSRRGATILSYEGAEVLSSLPAEVRVKISFGLVQVLPSLRVFSVRVPSSEVWRIDGQSLVTPRGVVRLADGLERPGGRPSAIEVCLTRANLVAATNLISWAKPGVVRLMPPAAVADASGQMDLFTEPAGAAQGGGDAEITEEVARQFFVACGWERCADGAFRR